METVFTVTQVCSGVLRCVQKYDARFEYQVIIYRFFFLIHLVRISLKKTFKGSNSLNNQMILKKIGVTCTYIINKDEREF